MTRLQSDIVVPFAIIDTIIARTVGVLLFIEELTKAIVETRETSVSPRYTIRSWHLHAQRSNRASLRFSRTFAVDAGGA